MTFRLVVTQASPFNPLPKEKRLKHFWLWHTRVAECTQVDIAGIWRTPGDGHMGRSSYTRIYRSTTYMHLHAVYILHHVLYYIIL